MIPDKAEAYIAGANMEKASEYEAYFHSITPITVEDIFRRWMFAYASVHTTWKYNCALFDALKDLDWLGNYHVLRQKIIDSRAGLHNARTEFIMRFADFYWKHPYWFNRQPDEDWFDYRDRIMAKSPGIGRAKAAFLLEMVYFHQNQVACFDTHMVQLYGYKAKQYGQGVVRNGTMDAMERHWTETCQKHGLSPCTARWMWWDDKQGYNDSRYWSHVLEDD